MKNLIYQYWDGDLLPGVKAGSATMKAYAKRIGATYLFEHNPRFVTHLGRYSPHYGSFKPVYDESFHVYDNILFTDTDVFPVEGLEENIFEGFDAELGICTEPFQPKARQKKLGKITSDMDNNWAAILKANWGVEVPRTSEGLVKVYNSGVVMYSNRGLLGARKRFVPFREYVGLMRSKKVNNFYTSDQGYLHAMLTVAKMDFVELDNGWNSFVHHYYADNSRKKLRLNDSRTKDTKFVHIQLRGADHLSAEQHWKITNLPSEKWGI